MEQENLPNEELTNNTNASSVTKKLKDSVIFKGAIVGALILIMLIPMPFITNLISERKKNQENVVREIGDKYGKEQSLYGVFLRIPFKEQKHKNLSNNYYYLVPKNLNIAGEITPFYKKRNLYNVLLYNAKMHIDANFDKSTFTQNSDINNYDLANAEIIFALKNIGEIEEEITGSVNGTSTNIGEYKTIYIKDNTEKVVDCASIPLNINNVGNINVSFDVKLKGANALNIASLANKTEINITTPIKNLKFDGSSLPLTDVSEKGNRKIKWKISSILQKNIYQSSVDCNEKMIEVEIIQPNDEYGKTNRVAKYAILFIGLTFLTFYFIEIINKMKIHPVQYALVGLALCVFYMLLLSFSEYIGFNFAYIISALATIILITLFVKTIVKKLKITGIVFFVLIALYSYIFIIIQLDEFALLAGSIGLFIILGSLMFFSRKVDWKNV